ncbi:MAG TPA: hypothetical protein VI056_07440 [Candidatus Limnocylindria bacterium]
MDRPRLYAASVALAVPAAVFALNALVSYRERGFVELFDLPAAIAFAIPSFWSAAARDQRSTARSLWWRSTW